MTAEQTFERIASDASVLLAMHLGAQYAICE
jgi:hypothetical protein